MSPTLDNATLIHSINGSFRHLLNLFPGGFQGFPGDSGGKESACNAGDLGLIPGLGRSPRGGHGNPLQYSCLENPHGQRSLAGYNPWGRKEWVTLWVDWETKHTYPNSNLKVIHGHRFHQDGPSYIHSVNIYRVPTKWKTEFDNTKISWTWYLSSGSSQSGRENKAQTDTLQGRNVVAIQWGKIISSLQTEKIMEPLEVPKFTRALKDGLEVD